MSPVFSVSFVRLLILSRIEIHPPRLFINALQQYKDQHLNKILQDICTGYFAWNDSVARFEKAGEPMWRPYVLKKKNLYRYI